MSYEIIRGLKIDTKNNRVMINSACSSMTPKTFEWFEATSLSTILREQGKEEIEKIFLENYWNGNFQQGNNAYNKTVQFYSIKLPYCWENTGEEKYLGKEVLGRKIIYSTEQLKNALFDCLQKFRNRDLSRRWVIKGPNGVGFVIKKTIHGGTWATFSNDINNTRDAKVFKSYEDAWLYCPGHEIVEIPSKTKLNS
jgi:hypothetical protein